jgi:dynactin complex subunit
MSDVPFRVGDRVVWLGRYRGTVAFVGNTQFAPGPWVGLSLERPSKCDVTSLCVICFVSTSKNGVWGRVVWADGKNDGSVQGVRYFQSEPGHGIFLRAGVLKVRGPASCVGGVARVRSPESLVTCFTAL